MYVFKRYICFLEYIKFEYEKENDKYMYRDVYGGDRIDLEINCVYGFIFWYIYKMLFIL